MSPEYTEGRAEGLAIALTAIADQARWLDVTGDLEPRHIAEWIWINGSGRSYDFLLVIAEHLGRIQRAHALHPANGDTAVTS